MIREYHFHLYFSAETRDSARDIRERLVQQRDFAVLARPLRDPPIGPHLHPQFGAAVPPLSLEAALCWYLFNRGQHTVLLHPNTGDDLLDHTQHATWLGTPLPLDCSAFLALSAATARRSG